VQIYTLGPSGLRWLLLLEIIGDTTLTAEEVSQAFADAGQPTRRWLFDDSALRAYECWVEKTLARLVP